MDKQASLKYLQTIVRDTPPEIIQMQQDMWEKMSPEKRLQLTFEHIETCRQIFYSGLRNRHPDWSEEEIILEAFRITYRDDYSEKEMEEIITSLKEYHGKNKIIL
jgi:hypothetical protein